MSPGSGARPATTDHPASRLVDTRRQPAVAGPAARSPQWGVAVLLALLFGVGAAIARRPDIAVLGALFALIAVSTPRRFGNQHVPTVEFDRSTRGPLLGGARRRILFRDAANNTQAGPALMVVRAVAPGGRESAVVTTTAESTGLGIRVLVDGGSDATPTKETQVQAAGSASGTDHGDSPTDPNSDGGGTGAAEEGDQPPGKNNSADSSQAGNTGAADAGASSTDDPNLGEKESPKGPGPHQ